MDVYESAPEPGFVHGHAHGPGTRDSVDAMQIITAVKNMQAWADAVRRQGKRIGFVPTMGYLHKGHLSLLRIARERSDLAAVSIFVNPMQFGPAEDYERYPRDPGRDRLLLTQQGCDVLFLPSAAEMYPQGYLTSVEVGKITKRLCGGSRPGHFRGVTTIVAKLFNCVKPHVAVFGQKDAQQAIVIRKMVEDLDLDVEIVVGPTIREPDGLAMSSRNTYLSAEERQEATILCRSLLEAREMIRAGERRGDVVRDAVRRAVERKRQARVEYVAVVDTGTLEEVRELKGQALVALAVWFGKTRLIDNILVEVDG